ncbi:unnamed protein product, partial [Urochloa humidicola]
WRRRCCGHGRSSHRTSWASSSTACAPILREGVFRYLAVDNLAFLTDNYGGCSLMNPLSGLTLPLPKLAPAVRQTLENSPY